MTGPAGAGAGCFAPVACLSPRPLPEPGVVHLWRLHGPSARMPLPLHALSPDEQARAARFVFPSLREAWRQARALQRAVLSAYLRVAPQAPVFAAEPGGKPRLACEAHEDSPLQFNLSHAGDAVLLAVARGQPCGVDLEPLRHHTDDDALAAACLSPGEHRRWRQLRPGQRRRALLQAWTRKEAWLKCTGTGLRVEPRSLHMPWCTQRRPHVYVPPAAPAAAPGELLDLPLGHGFVSALAVQPRLSAWQGHCLGWPSD